MSDDVLRYYPSDRRLEWNGKEWLITPHCHILLTLLLETKGKWVETRDIAARVWPAVMPDRWENCITHLARRLAEATMETSLCIQSARTHMKTNGGYRAIGDIEVMPVSEGKCPCCGRAIEK